MIAGLPFIFNILIKNDYREAYFYIPIMVISVYFSNMSNFCSGIFSAYKDTKILAKTTIVATLINLVVGVVGIRYIGLYATVIATLTSYFIIFLYRNYKLRKYIILKKDKYLFLNMFVLLLVTLLYYTKNYLLCLVGLLVALFYTYYLNKPFINSIIKKIRRKV